MHLSNIFFELIFLVLFCNCHILCLRALKDTVHIPEGVRFIQIQVHIIISERNYFFTHLKLLKSIKIHEFVMPPFTQIAILALCLLDLHLIYHKWLHLLLYRTVTTPHERPLWPLEVIRHVWYECECGWSESINTFFR